MCTTCLQIGIVVLVVEEGVGMVIDDGQILSSQSVDRRSQQQGVVRQNMLLQQGINHLDTTVIFDRIRS